MKATKENWKKLQIISDFMLPQIQKYWESEYSVSREKFMVQVRTLTSQQLWRFVVNCYRAKKFTGSDIVDAWHKKVNTSN